jgi:superoxide dismutase
MCQVKKFLKIAGIAALVATLGVIAVGAVAFAQGPFEGPGIGPFGGGHGRFPLLSPEQAEAHHEQMQQAMADALGMTVEELDAAHAEGKTPWEIAEEQGVDLADVRDTMRVPFEQMLDQAIAGGMLTQEQADTIHQHMADGHGPWEGRGGFPRFPGKHGDHPFLDPEQAGAHHEAMQQAIADAFGLTVEELDAAHAEGKTLWGIAEEQGVDLADVRDTMRVPFEQMLDQAVAGEMLTQEQADTIRQRMDNMPGGSLWGPAAGFPGFPGKHGAHPVLSPEQAEAHHEQMQQAVAEALGLTVEELEAARDEGQTLWEIAEEQSVDMAEVGEALKTAGQELLDQASADGTLTQEQADTIRQHTEDMPGRGPWGMRGRFPRFPHWHGDAK